MIWVLTAWFGLILLKHQIPPAPSTYTYAMPSMTGIGKYHKTSATGDRVSSQKIFFNWTPYSPVSKIPKMQSLGFNAKSSIFLLFRLKWHRFIPFFRVAKLAQAVLVANWPYEGNRTRCIIRHCVITIPRVSSSEKSLLKTISYYNPILPIQKTTKTQEFSFKFVSWKFFNKISVSVPSHIFCVRHEGVWIYRNFFSDWTPYQNI